MMTRFAPLASIAAPIGLALAALATPAAAQTISIDVSYADLDLTSPQGQAALDRRIDSAAREICGGEEQRTGTRIVMNTKVRTCIAEVKAKAAIQVAAAKRERQLGG